MFCLLKPPAAPSVTEEVEQPERRRLDPALALTEDRTFGAILIIVICRRIAAQAFRHGLLLLPAHALLHALLGDLLAAFRLASLGARFRLLRFS